MRDDALASIEISGALCASGEMAWRWNADHEQWELKDNRFFVKEACAFTPREANEKPFAFLRDVYDQRMRYSAPSPTTLARNSTSFRPTAFTAKWPARWRLAY